MVGPRTGLSSPWELNTQELAVPRTGYFSAIGKTSWQRQKQKEPGRSQFTLDWFPLAHQPQRCLLRHAHRKADRWKIQEQMRVLSIHYVLFTLCLSHSSGCYTKVCMMLTKLISHGSGGWDVQDQGASTFASRGRPSFWLVGGCFLTVCSCD